jgi:hypothetical protein
MPHGLSRPNLVLPAGEWVNIYELASIPYGKRIVVHNIGASDVYLTTSTEQPEKDSDAYQVIQPNDLQMINEAGSSGEWAFSPNQSAKINVRPV